MADVAYICIKKSDDSYAWVVLGLVVDGVLTLSEIHAADGNGLGLYDDGGTTGILVKDGGDVDMDGVLSISEIRAIDGDGLKLYDDGGAGIFVKDGGNVGVGESDPATKLDVGGAVTQHGLNADPANPSNGAFVVWQSDGTGSGESGDILWKSIDGSGNAQTRILRQVDREIVSYSLVDSDTACAVEDGVIYFVVPSILNGYTLTGAVASVTGAVGVTGTMDIQIRRKRSGVDTDMLTSPISIASGAWTASNGTIDTSNDEVQTGDVVSVDIDTIHTTPAEGLAISLTFMDQW